MKSFEALIHQCDLDIKAGRPAEARKRLLTLNANRMAREWRLPLAKICRRAGLFSLGLKLLGKVILTDSKAEGPGATHGEQAEYAVLLQRNGALREALKTLGGVDSQRVPEVPLYRAFVHFARWEFDQAIPELKKYLQSDLKEHARAVGQINLAFALVESRHHQEALTLLQQIANSVGPQMLSNCHALMGQVHLQQGEYAYARREYVKARALVSGAQTNDQFFAIKGCLILDGLVNKDLSAFARLRALALQYRSWEARREADLYSLKVDFQYSRFLHLYCGSPYAGFRERLRSEFAITPMESVYILGSPSAPRMDLRTGRVDGHPALTSGRKCHQLIDLLLHDFYRPTRVGGIFSDLFPEEQFNASSSPHRVHQLISRTRQWLKKEGIPATINEDANFYSLQLEGPFSFEVPIERSSVDLTNLQIEKLTTAFGQKQFSAQDAIKSLGLSQATVYRLIQKGIQARKIERLVTYDRTSLFQMAHLSHKKAA